MTALPNRHYNGHKWAKWRTETEEYLANLEKTEATDFKESWGKMETAAKIELDGVAWSVTSALQRASMLESMQFSSTGLFDSIPIT